MLYDIRLKIGYVYGSGSDHARTQVRLLPPDLPGRQVVTRRLLTVDPTPSEQGTDTDFFGNMVTSLVFHEPIDRIEISMGAQVERLQTPPVLDFSPRVGGLAQEVSQQKTLDALSPHHYLGTSPRIADDPEIAAFARTQTSPEMTAMQAVVRIGQALHEEMRFDPEATDAQTPPSVAFANRHGVCQDFSHVMIGCLRALGIPAGYVSGFLRTIPPPGQPRLEGADAMHAWVTAWCGVKTGWIEYDPTNACAVETDHIVVGYGRDYGDVAPVRGVLKTSGAQDSHQSVDVVPL